MEPTTSDPTLRRPAALPLGPHRFLEDGGETGRLARATDWAATPLGPVERWSHSLRAIVGTILHSRHPMFLWWGPDLVQIYNDAYLPSFGNGKHPAAMGQAGRDCWQEIWPIIWPQIDAVMREGVASWHDDQLVPILRNGKLEDVYWTYGYSPVFDDDGSIGGTLVVCTETTGRVLSDRRSRVLREVAEEMAFATSPAELLDGTVARLAEHESDLPFALFYAFDVAGGRAQLSRSIGLSNTALDALDAHYGAMTAARLKVLPSYGPLPLPPTASPWPVDEREASGVFIAPLATASAQGLRGFVVFGISAKLSFDRSYSDFLVQIAQQIGFAQSRLEASRIRAATEGERNNLLLQAPVATAVMTGPTHIFRLANPLYLQMVGKDQQLIGKAYLEAFPELANTPAVDALDHVYRTGAPFVTQEMLLPLDRRGDGTLDDCFFRFNLQPMRDIEGSVYGMMAVAIDITDQVASRRVLERAQVEREKLLGELEAASRAKDEFLAMLGHELRNPLSPIVTALQLMKLRDHEPSRERMVIERQVTHLVRLVDDLLDISKITRGKIELRRESVELADVLAKAVEMASFLLEQRSHQLTIRVASGLHWEGDPMRLAQVVSNLLTNAARYTDVGAGRIELSAHGEGDTVVISVKDNGNGIDPDMLPRVFDLFFQGKRSSDRAEGGLGIGLTLVKNLVTLHGGTVAAKSDGIGKGTELIVRLPAVTPALHMAPASAAVEHGSRTELEVKRVLLVDDNEDALELLAEVLRTLGLEVAVATDPVSALAVMKSFRPEIAVLDIGLPVMDGYELAVKMRQTMGTQPCRLIALTGYGQDHDRDKSGAAGFAAHLVKPVDVQSLLALFAGNAVEHGGGVSSR